MIGIEDMSFYVERNRDGKFTGRVTDLPDLRTRPKANRLDALDDIITMASERVAEIHERMGMR